MKYNKNIFWHLPPFLKTLGLFILLTTPIILFCLEFLATGNRLAGGDADYYMQTQEAARISLLKYHQFPWWNSWVAGGVPLFANPQYGLISLQSLLVILFGSIMGYKLALVAYFIIGFWGLYLLFIKSFRTPKISALLLAYIWTFGSFLVYRAAGHYTFYVVQFFPWLLYFFLERKSYKHAWLWIGLILGLMANTAAHYMTIMSFTIFGIFIISYFVRIGIKYVKKRSVDLKISIDINNLVFIAKAFVVFLILAGYRLFFAVGFAAEFPRQLIVNETSIGFIKALFAIFGPFRQFNHAPAIPLWSWMEASAYIGAATGIVALICSYLFIKQRINKIYTINPLILLFSAIVFFVLGLGVFIGPLSPFFILKHLPVFADMRVATRWLAWCSLFILMFIAVNTSKKYRKAINVLLFCSVIELFIFNQPYLAKPYIINPTIYKTGDVINQQASFDNKREGVPYDENLTATTSSNIGQVIAGDSLVFTLMPPPIGMNTIRCDSDKPGCPFVLTKNADIVYWSPNKISLKRTASGPIKLNTNPGRYWLVNDRYAFLNYRAAEPDKEFIIHDSNEDIELRVMPKYSIEWFIWKVGKRF